MIGRVIVLVAAVASMSGCYVYTAAPTAPPVGTHFVLDLNDRGRVGMGDSIGSAARSVEGVLTNSGSDSVFALKVSKISYLSGQSNTWMGEQLVVPKAFVGLVRQKSFSKSRSWLVAGGVAAAVVAFIASRDVLGFGNSPRDPGNPDPKEN